MQETGTPMDRLMRAGDGLRGDMSVDSIQQLLLVAVFLRHASDVPEDVAQRRPNWKHLVDQVGQVGSAKEVVRWALRAWSGDYGLLRLDLDDDPVFAELYAGGPRTEQALRDLFTVLDRAGRELPMAELYEQCLARFSEDRTGGEYYTPRGVVRTMVALMAPAPGDEVYDPACGSAGFLTEAARYVEAQHGPLPDRDRLMLRLYGQDVNARTRRIAAMNLILHGLDQQMGRGLGQGDSLLQGSEASEKHSVVLANPPFSMPWQNPGHGPFVPWRYGQPPKSKADFAWVQHALGSLKPGGRAAILLANGASFRGGAERHIRAGLVRDDVLTAVIQLPPGLFSHTRIPACVWIFDRSKRLHTQSRVLFIDARDVGVQVSRGRRALTEGDIARIAGTCRDWSAGREGEEPGWCRTVTVEEIEAADFDLQPARYVSPVKAEATPGEDERRVRELTQDLYGYFAEAARLEHELRTVLEAS
ncbi:N-6 DNA methylase [Streptomyces sp. NPDC057540]|uniref:N-6 DNA methylase n=1 Tax=Streptomyces sp. NPDC057540 TaxID=3346160 RepID=UPI0036CD6F7E